MFEKWWQHLPSLVKPEIFKIGSFALRYYSLMYILAFLTIYLLVRYRIKKQETDLSLPLIESYFTWSILGAILGGRLGYVFFYDFSYFSNHPAQIFLPFVVEKGRFYYTGISGMSYHGGLIGVIIASYFFCKQKRISFIKLADLFVPTIPLGYFWGRLGNFFNGELYGRVTTVKWGMYFEDGLLRHPSQLYEALGEGIFLFFVLWYIRNKQMAKGNLLAFYLIGYGSVRFIIEFFRQPDPQLGLILGPFTLGQLFCALMIIGGVSFFIGFRHKKNV